MTNDGTGPAYDRDSLSAMSGNLSFTGGNGSDLVDVSVTIAPPGQNESTASNFKLYTRVAGGRWAQQGGNVAIRPTSMSANNLTYEASTDGQNPVNRAFAVKVTYEQSNNTLDRSASVTAPIDPANGTKTTVDTPSLT